jgi:hypothetical protein
MGKVSQSENRSVAKMRRSSGLTQHEVSRRTGIGLNRLVFFETGRAPLLPDEVDKIRSVVKKHARQVAKDAR